MHILRPMLRISFHFPSFNYAFYDHLSLLFFPSCQEISPPTNWKFGDDFDIKYVYKKASRVSGEIEVGFAFSWKIFKIVVLGDEYLTDL